MYIVNIPLLLSYHHTKVVSKICVSLRRQTLSRKKESAEVGRDLAMSMLNLANHHNSYSNKSYHINIFKPITA